MKVKSNETLMSLETETTDYNQLISLYDQLLTCLQQLNHNESDLGLVRQFQELKFSVVRASNESLNQILIESFVFQPPDPPYPVNDDDAIKVKIYNRISTIQLRQQ